MGEVFIVVFPAGEGYHIHRVFKSEYRAKEYLRKKREFELRDKWVTAEIIKMAVE